MTSNVKVWMDDHFGGRLYLVSDTRELASGQEESMETIVTIPL